MLEEQHYRLNEAGREALFDYIRDRMTQPHFANARSIRNALDRTRAGDPRASRVFKGGIDGLGGQGRMNSNAETSG
jgi:AAA lid domain